MENLLGTCLPYEITQLISLSYEQSNPLKKSVFRKLIQVDSYPRIFKICFNLLKFNIQFIRTQKMKENYTGLLRWTAVDGCFKLTSTHLQFGASNETLSKFA